jgi:hypothetical protein
MTTEIVQKTTESKSAILMSDIVKSKVLMPNNIDEAYRIAKAFSRSNFIPNQYQGKPDEAFSAIVLGMEIGLPPMRSLQSIAVVNGKPCVYGDAQLALVKNSGKLIDFKESYKGKAYDNDFTAICELRREGDKESTIEEFSVQDAKNAKLWGKQGPWQTHQKRMLRYKCRAFALRDKFPDVLLGLTHSVEEMQGEESIKDVTPKTESNINLSNILTKEEE